MCFVANIFTLTSIIAGQVPLISPVLITGLVGESVTFICDSQLPGEGISLGLLIYDPMSDRFVFFTNSDCRLQRVDDGSVATFTFGPLTASDDGTIFRCQSSNGMSSANVTVSVLCMYYLMPATYYYNIILILKLVLVVCNQHVGLHAQTKFMTHTCNMYVNTICQLSSFCMSFLSLLSCILFLLI